jgi:hypothetical protein
MNWKPVVLDSAGQKLAYVYYEDESGRRSAAKLLSRRMPIACFAIAAMDAADGLTKSFAEPLTTLLPTVPFP